jgi:hypothetical protein
MITRATDDNGDFTFGRGKAGYRTGRDAITQNVKTRLLSWKGDCFYAPAEGVDYNNFLSVGTKTFLDSDVKRVILQSEGVLSIENFESEINDRGYTCQVEILTIYGADQLEV